TVAHFSPGILKLLLADHAVDRCRGLRRVFCGGESLTPEIAEDFFAKLPATSLHHQYGPTEATVDATIWDCAPGDTRHPLPIGRPIANARAYVLSPSMQPAPIGVVGELYLGGRCLAQGYLGRPDLTAERFVPNPFDSGLLYRTGDRARWRREGIL